MVTRRTVLTGIAAAAFWSPAWCRVGGVKIGVCTSDVGGAAKYGFDYIEPAAAEIAAMREDQFREYTDTVLASPVHCHAFNSFIRRPDLKVVGPDASISALRDYLQICLPRCHRLGAAIVVWGSAGSRNVPEGFLRPRARDQIASFLHMAGELGSRYDMVVAIEPLRHQESNILNTGAEVLEMVRTVKHPNVRMIIDYFHLREENEDPRILEVARQEVVHLHFANPHGRLWPHKFSEDDHYGSFFHYLKKIGYSGGISIEGKGSLEEDGAASLEFLRRAVG
jgi:D-psicose/D-tagatose/L-ribulose 3-epimerase